MRKSIARRARNQRAPYACIEAVEAACKMPFDEGCAFERKLFDELVDSEEARALRYAFFAEREVTKLPHIPADTPQRPTDKPGVVGAGTMGGGIAMSFADNGFDVKHHRRDQGGARSRHGAHPRQLRNQRQARQPRAGRDGTSARAHPSGRELSTISPIAMS